MTLEGTIIHCISSCDTIISDMTEPMMTSDVEDNRHIQVDNRLSDEEKTEKLTKSMQMEVGRAQISMNKQK
jgi:hypothetical protein